MPRNVKSTKKTLRAIPEVAQRGVVFSAGSQSPKPPWKMRSDPAYADADAWTPTTLCIYGREFDRIPYGNEASDWGADSYPCLHCDATKGELHLLGCDGEQCPSCGGQAIFCGCEYEGDDDNGGGQPMQ